MYWYSSVFEEKETDVFEPKQNDAAMLVRYKWTEIGADNYMPTIFKLFFELFFDELSHVLVVFELAIMLHFCKKKECKLV